MIHVKDFYLKTFLTHVTNATHPTYVNLVPTQLGSEIYIFGVNLYIRICVQFRFALSYYTKH